MATRRKKAGKGKAATLNFPGRTLYHADNLGVLRGMNSGTVDLIATDPPFNKGRDFHATPDSLADGASFQDRWSWEEDVHEEWVDLIKDDWPAVWEVIDAAKASFGADMSAFLCFMGVRIMEMRRVLKDTGSIYLHCDPTASHYLKLMMDAVFGRGNFRNEIVWRIGWISGYKTQKKGFIRNHDVLLYYVKGPGFTFNKFFLPYPPGYVRRDGKPPNGKGIPLEDTWNCNAADVLDSIMIKSFSKEKTGYPTQKPLALYERIIRASSREGDIVLDPFCGCATTLIAAERLGRNWVGIDIWDEAHEIVWDRLLGEGLAVKGARKKGQGLLGEKDISYETVAPVRTDAGDEAVPLLKTVEKIDEPKGARRTRKQMLEFLIGRHGCKCFGCDRVFDDPDYLDLDHNTPRADGGINHISNRILLCSPCNRRKGHTLTLSGLRKRNAELGKMSQTPTKKRLPR